VIAKKTNTKRAWGYARVSTEEQAVHGVSLEAQTEKIRGWCLANGYELADVLIDRGLSGGRFDNRPALKEALRNVDRGDSLVFYSLSRLARSVRDTLMIADTLEKRGADMVSLSEKIDTTTSAGTLLFRMLAVLSEFERDLISERTAMAMAQLRSAGRYLGGLEPYGFRSIDGVLHVAPEEAQVIRLIHELGAQGCSLRSISRQLLLQGITTRPGKAFHPSQIARILRVPIPEIGSPSMVTAQPQAMERAHV
jgi:site-specific DNA recombinase